MNSTDAAGIGGISDHNEHTADLVRLLCLLSADLAYQSLLPALIIQRRDVIVNEPLCPIAALDEQSGELTSRPGSSAPSAPNQVFGQRPHELRPPSAYVDKDDAGGASRYYPNLDPPFFYAAKSSRRERNTGCDGLYWLADDTRGSGYRPITRTEYDAAQEAGERVARGNMHPCVKNIKLLNWLINLLTVPGDTILDPFAGSGSIGVAAIQGGRSFVGVEMDPDYMAIVEARLAEALARPRQAELDV